MKSEELVESLNTLKDQALKSHNDTAILDVKVENFVWVIEATIKALEQEPILDKIRDEIAYLTITEGGEDYTRKMAELYSLKIKVLQIIDKYIAESEG